MATFNAILYIQVVNLYCGSYLSKLFQSSIMMSCARSFWSSVLRQYVLQTLKMIPLCFSIISTNLSLLISIGLLLYVTILRKPVLYRSYRLGIVMNGIMVSICDYMNFSITVFCYQRFKLVGIKNLVFFANEHQ